MDFKSILNKISELQESIKEEKTMLRKGEGQAKAKQPPAGRVHKGTYGTDYGTDEEGDEKKKKEYSFFGEIISIIHLDRFDELTNKHWANEIKMTLVKEYSTKDKENPMHYKLVIYYKVNDSNVLDTIKAQEAMPVDKRK